MRQQHKLFITLIASLLVLTLLLYQGFPLINTVEQWSLVTLLGGLLLFVLLFGFVKGTIVISLLPLTAVSGYLILGKETVVWLLWTALLLHGVIRYGRWVISARKIGLPPAYLVQIILLNMIIHVVSLEVGGTLYEALGGELPLVTLKQQAILPLFTLSIGYIASNHIVFIFLLWITKTNIPHNYLKKVSVLIIYELTPLIFSPLFPLVYNLDGIAPFGLLITGYVIIVLVCYRLSRLHQKLNGRIEELNLLHSVSQSLGGTLSLSEIGQRLHQQLNSLLPIDHFALALINETNSDITYIITVEKGRQVAEPTDPANRWLIKKVWADKRPLFLNQPDHAQLAELNLLPDLNIKGHWIGLPIKANGVTHGVLALQILNASQSLPKQHIHLLETTASQVGLTISNALRYSKTDEALTQSVEELHSILATTMDGILLLDRESHILMQNRAFEQLIEPAQQNQAQLLTQLGFTQASWQEAQKLAQQKANGYKQKITVAETAVERTLMPVKNPKGGIGGWLIILRDISEELALNQLREDMIHMLVHDLRSPLNAIITGISSSQRLVEKGDHAPLPRLLQHAYDGSSQMMRLINQLLDIYRFEGDFVRLDREFVTVESLFAGVSWRFTAQLEEAQIELQHDVASTWLAVHVDPTYLNRALDNLVDNGIKFTPDNGRIRLFAHPDPEQPQMLLLGVQDSGNGIPPAAQATLFQKFVYGNNKLARRKGSGLGLAYCQLVVEAHGGQIWVESSGFPSEGATFTMRLALATEAEQLSQQ